MNIKQALNALSKELGDKSIALDLYICGGAALNLLGVTSRQTADIDVLLPTLDENVKVAAKSVFAFASRAPK